MPERNPFAVQERPRQESPSVGIAIAQQRELAEVQGSMVMARRFPRDRVGSMDRILQECRRPTLAKAAIYSYPRGDTQVSGPSIRLAEAIAQNWGNITFGIRELSQQDGESTVESYAWDLETNARATKIFQVPHVRYTKKGSYTLTDPRDVYELVANQGARRLRACILAVVPGDVIEAAVKECEETQRAQIGDIETATERMVKAFGEYKISRQQIEVRLGHRLDSISAAEIINMGKLYTSIKDGMVSANDVFPPVDTNGKKSAKDKVAQAAAKLTGEDTDASGPQGAATGEESQAPGESTDDGTPKGAASKKAKDSGQTGKESGSSDQADAPELEIF